MEINRESWLPHSPCRKMDLKNMVNVHCPIVCIRKRGKKYYSPPELMESPPKGIEKMEQLNADQVVAVPLVLQ